MRFFWGGHFEFFKLAILIFFASSQWKKHPVYMRHPFFSALFFSESWERSCPNFYAHDCSSTTYLILPAAIQCKDLLIEVANPDRQYVISFQLNWAVLIFSLLTSDTLATTNISALFSFTAVRVSQMFKLVNQCWPQIFQVKYTQRMWENQKKWKFFDIFNRLKPFKVLVHTALYPVYWAQAID